MSLISVPSGRAAVPVVPSSAPAPRALIDYDFQSVLTAPPKQRRVLWLMAGVIVSAAIVLAVAKVDIVVSANGRMVTSDSEIVIQPFETSVVRSITVKMGQQVKAGDILATLDPTFTQADKEELAAKFRVLNATFDRIGAELQGVPYDPPNPTPDEATQRDIFRKRHDEYAAKLAAAQHKVEGLSAELVAGRAEVKNLREQVRLASAAQSIYDQLVAKNLASKLRLIDTNQRLVDAKSKLDGNAAAQDKLVLEIAEAQANVQGFIQEWQRKLSEEMAQIRGDRDGTEARLAKAKMRRDLDVMTAPRDATVLEVARRPAGSVVREAEPLITLVPSDAPLVSEVEVDTRDVARLHIGDPVTLKFEALPWQQFGLAYGELKALTPDTLNDDNPSETAADLTAPGMKSQVRQSPIHFRARIALTETRFRNLPEGFALRPGMRVLADIKVGRRPILEYVLNPITRVIRESLREP
jgi:hemolysin D